MKNGGRRNVREHRKIKNGENYITLEISLKFFNMNKMIITSSEPNYYLGRSGKGLITSLDIKTIRRSKNIKKARFEITEVSLKDIYNIIKEFKDVPYKDYTRKSSKHMPTYSYFYLARKLAKCRMSDSHVPVRTQKMSTQNMSNSNMSTQKIPNLHLCSTDESE